MKNRIGFAFLITLVAIFPVLLVACSQSEQVLSENLPSNCSFEKTVMCEETNTWDNKKYKAPFSPEDAEELRAILKSIAEGEETDTMDGQNRRNKLFEKPLSEIETEEVSRQSNILQDIEIEEQFSDMPIADLSEYFVRCQRFENTETMSSIRSARYELLAKETESATIEGAYWILTSENGTEYWLLGFTDHPFEALAVFRNGPEGEMLYGQIR